MRLFLAILFSKLTYGLLRLMGRNASHYPGAVALFICKDYLARIRKPPLCIGVTGTNGKTTVTNMVADFMTDNGYRVASNRLGSNIVEGVCTAYTNSVNIFGKPKVDAMVLEIDERASRLMLPSIKPDYLICTGLFRDSIMRNAHPEYIFDILDTYIPDSTFMILNADDPFSSRLKPENPRAYFAVGRQPGDELEPENIVMDNTICPVCLTKLSYTYRHYHHIGNAYCPACGWASPKADCMAITADTEKKLLTVKAGEDTLEYPLINDALFNIYNEAALITLMRKIGFKDDVIASSIGKVAVTETRLREHTAGGVKVISTLSKGSNSIAVSRNLDNISRTEGRKCIFIAYDDYGYRKHSVEYAGWLYDADYEFLAGRDDVIQVVAGGPRCYDQQMRLLMAGVPKEKIFTAEDEISAVDLVMTSGIDAVYILYDTTTYELSVKLSEMIEKRLAEADK